MARKKAGTVPDLQQHKATGQGKVHLSGRDFYCGKWGTAACKASYDRLIAASLHGGLRPLECLPAEAVRFSERCGRRDD